MSFMAGLSRILMNLMTGRPAGCADELLERARKYNSVYWIRFLNRKICEEAVSGRNLL